MKNIIIGVATAVITVLLILCIYTLQGDTVRKNETADAITQAMENAAAKMEEEENTYQDNEAFRAAFVENLLLQVDSASHLKVRVLMSDYEKGLIQAEVIETYKTPNGKEKAVSQTRTIVLEKYKKNS